ncbi:hypothetical protein B0G82_7851 [Paraburkholderia sp. BL17N1]|nr:hypothetical protein B0G82_7851 [Paraburkholderia sp. BL17N1]
MATFKSAAFNFRVFNLSMYWELWANLFLSI